VRRCKDGTTVTPWSAPSRQQLLRRLKADKFDVVVIGGESAFERFRQPWRGDCAGGCVGAGVALEAATRGLSVAMVEADDFAAGEW
jgi:glycerol-3-phosphate dehydrogenase